MEFDCKAAYLDEHGNEWACSGEHDHDGDHTYKMVREEPANRPDYWANDLQKSP